jgi:hypothetical protein
MKRVLILSAFSFVLGMQAVWGQIPQTISYQGVLTDASGEAVPDGSYNLSFKLYDVASGGTALWSEAQPADVSKGVFNVILGSVTPLTLGFDKPYWLGVAVGQDPELTPRIELTAAAYSLNARSVADSAVTGRKIASGQVVRSLNSIKDEITLAAGENVTITHEGRVITIAAAGGNGAGNTLDQAYDQGGAGAGREIIADAGAVNISGPDGLTVSGHVGMGTEDAEYQLTVDETDAEGAIEDFRAARVTLTREVADSVPLRNTQALQVKSVYASPEGTYYAPKAVEAVIENISTAGEITEASALRGEVHNFSGSIESANCLYARLQNLGTGTITRAHSLFIASPFNVGSIENNYGIFIESQGIAPTPGSNNYAIYSMGGNVYFADSVGIGTDHPRGNLHLSSDSDTKLRITNGQGRDVAIVYNHDNDALEFRLGGDGTQTKVAISAGGNVGIGEVGDITPSNILTVDQGSATDPIADAWTTYSSRRWKTNIKPIEGAVDKVQRLRGVSFDWKENGQPDIGLIAEEVGEVIPEVVAYEENGEDAKSVDYARLVALLIEAVKEQQKEIEQQKTTIQTLQNRVTALEGDHHVSSR